MCSSYASASPPDAAGAAAAAPAQDAPIIVKGPLPGTPQTPATMVVEPVAMLIATFDGAAFVLATADGYLLLYRKWSVFTVLAFSAIVGTAGRTCARCGEVTAINCRRPDCA